MKSVDPLNKEKGKKAMRKRTLLISIGIIIVLTLIILGTISPITKYLVEKYDEKYTGRQITMDWVYVNPFTGYFYISGIKIYELQSDRIFLSSKGLSINIALLKLFSKTYELSEVTLNHPRGVITQNQKEFNISDLIELFSPQVDSTTTKAPVHFNIAHIKIIDGEFHYREKLIPVIYFIKKANFESDGKRWDTDTISTKFSFIPGIGSGDIKGDFTINLKNKDYRFSVAAQKFDLKFIQQYIKDMANYANFSASLDATLQAEGNLNDQQDISARGRVEVNDFHFGKDSTDDYASFENTKLVILELSPKNHQYLFDSVYVNNPYLKYERYDDLDNFQNMFGGKGAKITAAAADPYTFNLVIEVARYIKVLSKNFFKSDYKINHLAINNGDIKFNDFSLTEVFSAELNPIDIKADSIDKSHQRVNVLLKSDIKPYGNISVALSINPKDSGEYDMQYQLQKLPVSLFNPYIISYTSFALNRGTLECKGTWKVRNSNIRSNNQLMIIDPRVTKRLKNDDTNWLPLPFVMTLVRERGNMIDYDIPISGNLKDPKFHLADAFLDLLKNIFVKPPTTSYGIQVKNVETEIEKSLTLTWAMSESDLEQKQERFIERMADFLAKNPDAVIDIRPQHYEAKEKESILLFEAKKKFFVKIHNKTEQTFTDSDAESVDMMSVKDESFVKYLNTQVKDSMIFTIQEKSARLINSKIILAEDEQLKKERQEYFMSYFQKRKVSERIIFHPSQNMLPYNGFSYYKIEYKNELPKWLTKAYQEMNQLNEDRPRKKLKRKRQEIKNTL